MAFVAALTLLTPGGKHCLPESLRGLPAFPHEAPRQSYCITQVFLEQSAGAAQQFYWKHLAAKGWDLANLVADAEGYRFTARKKATLVEWEFHALKAGCRLEIKSYQ